MLMDFLSYLAGGSLIIIGSIQVVVAGLYACMLFRRCGASPDSEYSPNVAVILAIRGPDPFLDQTIRGLTRQQYGSYTVFIVVDSDLDIVNDDVRRILDELQPANFVVQTLKDRKLTCSLKCSALAEAVEQLDETYDVIAFIDGDAPPHPSWLRDLVSPLRDQTVGVVTGNRWFVPTDTQWGSLVRYLWNAAAIVQVWLNRIVWAGSMAMRSEVAGDPEMLNGWRKSLSVDAVVTRYVKSHGLKVYFEPTVIMFNEEGIGLVRFRQWVERQLIAAKSSGSVGALVFLHALSLSALQLVIFYLLGRAILADETAIVALLTVSIATYWFTAVVSLAMLEISLSRVAQRNSVSRSHLNWKVFVLLLPAMIVTHVVYAIALSRSFFRRRISWRGIEYEIHDINEVKLTNYHPFTDSENRIATESVI